MCVCPSFGFDRKNLFINGEFHTVLYWYIISVAAHTASHIYKYIQWNEWSKTWENVNTDEWQTIVDNFKVDNLDFSTVHTMQNEENEF